MELVQDVHGFVECIHGEGESQSLVVAYGAFGASVMSHDEVEPCGIGIFRWYES